MANQKILFRFVSSQTASRQSRENYATQQDFWVKPCWDAEAGEYYSESNIKGLHIEAETTDEFHALARELAPEMIRDNHPQDVSGTLSVRLELPEGR